MRKEQSLCDFTYCYAALLYFHLLPPKRAMQNLGHKHASIQMKSGWNFLRKSRRASTSLGII